MYNLIPLNSIPGGSSATVRRIDVSGGMRRRLMDIGLTPETHIECVGQSPGGDPRAYLIRGAVIAIRNRDCGEIWVSPPSEVKNHGSD